MQRSMAKEQGRELDMASYEHIGVTQSGMVATIEVRRGPNNFVDTDMVGEIADVLEGFDRTPDVRAIVLCAEGKHFCAGADFSTRGADGVARGLKRGRHLYKEAQRLWRTGKPIVAAVHGAAVGAGVGLAVMADFRVTCPEARFAVNFTRLGFHPGFGLTATLPRLIGSQQAALLMYTGRRITGEQALAIGAGLRHNFGGRARQTMRRPGRSAPANPPKLKYDTFQDLMKF